MWMQTLVDPFQGAKDLSSLLAMKRGRNRYRNRKAKDEQRRPRPRGRTIHAGPSEYHEGRNDSDSDPDSDWNISRMNIRGTVNFWPRLNTLSEVSP